MVKLILKEEEFYLDNTENLETLPLRLFGFITSLRFWFFYLGTNKLETKKALRRLIVLISKLLKNSLARHPTYVSTLTGSAFVQELLNGPS